MKVVRLEYIDLVSKYLGGELSASEFQDLYISKFKKQMDFLDENLYCVLDELFGDVDSYTTDEHLLKKDPDFYLDEKGLKEKAEKALAQLIELRDGLK